MGRDAGSRTAGASSRCGASLSATRRPPPIGGFGPRVALYGGSFDPVHLGHLHVARMAQERFELSQVVFVPAAQPPHKLGQTLAPAADRVRMLELALAVEPSWSVWTCELGRSGPSFTIDTLRSAPTELGLTPGSELFLVVGWDNLRGFERWRAVEEIVQRAQPIVVWRGEEDAAALEVVRLALGPTLGARLERGLLRAPPSPVSSTQVRAAIARGESPSAYLPPAVQEYIRARGIYSGRP